MHKQKKSKTSQRSNTKKHKNGKKQKKKKNKKKNNNNNKKHNNHNNHNNQQPPSQEKPQQPTVATHSLPAFQVAFDSAVYLCTMNLKACGHENLTCSNRAQVYIHHWKLTLMKLDSWMMLVFCLVATGAAVSTV